VIGIVSVGYLTSYIANINARILWQSGLYGAGFCCCCLFLLAVYPQSQKQMFRLEPKDIAQLVLQQRALLEAMYEGYLPSMMRSS
jgi:two-component system cit operon sensor histidine kinase CitA